MVSISVGCSRLVAISLIAFSGSDIQLSMADVHSEGVPTTGTHSSWRVTKQVAGAELFDGGSQRVDEEAAIAKVEEVPAAVLSDFLDKER